MKEEDQERHTQNDKHRQYIREEQVKNMRDKVKKDVSKAMRGKT